MSFRASLACSLCLALLPPLAHAAEKRLDRTFTVEPGGRLTVDADGSNVTVRGTDSNQVSVHIAATGSQDALDRMVMSAEPGPAGIAVTARRGRRDWLSWLWSDRLRDSSVTVSVPRRYQVEVKTSGGNLEIEQLQGAVTGTTSGGDIHVGNVNGNVRMRTSGGNIVASDIDGELRIETSGGDIRAAVDGRIRAVTSGGNIDVQLLGANRGVEISTSGGNILLHLPRNVTGVLNASTSGGSVVSDLPVATVATASARISRKLSGTINGGGEPIEAHTSGGDIQLRARD